MQSTKKKWWFTPIILLIIIILLHLFSLQHSWVEKIYSTHIYPVASSLLRILTGWLPFSFGDVLYGCIIAWVLIEIIRFFRSKPTWKKFFLSLRNLLVKCLWIYLVFLLLWGLNYYRFGIGYKLKLYPDMYNIEDLKTVTARLRDSLNTNRKLMDSLHITYADDKATLNQAVHLYDAAKGTYPYLNYDHPDAKKMLFGNVGNYGGFLGYYNPFTGEAQVNTKVPAFIIPFTTCHEIGHQLGYASESEASFVGYLVVRANNSPVFNYSTYFDLFAYANGELYSRDSVAARQNVKLLDTLVKKDYAEYRQYLRAYQNPVEPLLTKLYGKYLQAHNQPKGIESYDEVVAWIIAYYKKYGKL